MIKVLAWSIYNEYEAAEVRVDIGVQGGREVCGITAITSILII